MGGVVIDVGANLGIVTVILARRFSDRTVHALEPNPTTFSALQENLALNGCANVHAHALAAAGHEGVVIFDANPDYRGTTSITTADRPHAMMVQCTTLDSFMRQNAEQQDIAFLKVDVEGYETLVFRGATGILESRRAATIYFEVYSELAARCGFAPDQAARHLVDCGYQLNRFNAQGRLIPAQISEIKEVISENWVAFRQ